MIKPEIKDIIKPKKRLKIKIKVDVTPGPENFRDISAISSNSFWVSLGFTSIILSWASNNAFSIVSGSKKFTSMK